MEAKPQLNGAQTSRRLPSFFGVTYLQTRLAPSKVFVGPI